MLCQKCGKEIPNDSIYCQYCSTKVEDHFSPTKEHPVLFCTRCGRPTVDYNNLCTECQKNADINAAITADINQYSTLSGEANIHEGRKKHSVGIILLFLLVVIIFALPLLAYFLDATSKEPSVTADVSSVVISSSSKTEVDRAAMIKNASTSLAKNSEIFLKNYLKYPDTASIEYTACSLEFHRAYCISKGTIKYTNNQGVPVEKPFQVGMYTSNNYSCPVFVSLNDYILMDNRYLADDAGNALKDFTVNHKQVTKGTPVLENLIIIEDYINGTVQASFSATKAEYYDTAAKQNSSPSGDIPVNEGEEIRYYHDIASGKEYKAFDGDTSGYGDEYDEYRQQLEMQEFMKKYSNP